MLKIKQTFFREFRPVCILDLLFWNNDEVSIKGEPCVLKLSPGINHDITSSTINMNLYCSSLFKSWPFLALLFTFARSDSSESIVKPLQETEGKIKS